MSQENTSVAKFGVIEVAGFRLPIISEITIGKKGAAGKQYFTIDFAELLVVNEVGGVKTTDEATSLANLGKVFKGFESLLAFVQPDFNKAQVSLQVTTPANAKTPKQLTQDEKIDALRDYVATIDEEKKRRSGAASAMKRLTAEMSAAFAKGDMVNGTRLAQELALLFAATASAD